MKSLLLAGEVYSHNLGDQAIHACLAFLLKEQKPGLRVLPLDISGREVQAEDETSLSNKKLFNLINAWSGGGKRKAVMNHVYHCLLAQPRYAQKWKPLIEQADALVIGGGQLLMDNALDFPLKLSSLTRMATAHSLPVHISACGVGKNWSPAAKELFQPLVEQAASVTVRDGLSQERLISFLPGTTCRVTADPAILAAEVFPGNVGGAPAEQVGLGVMSREDANSRLPEKARFSKTEWMDLWLEMIRKLVSKNLKVEVFTTGNLQDEAFAKELFRTVHRINLGSIRLAARPGGVTGLLGTMRGYSLVIAARLHASILANALGISSLGLGWDEKVHAYYKGSDLPEHCISLDGIETEELVRASLELNRQPFSRTLLMELKDRARLNGQVILASKQ